MRKSYPIVVAGVIVAATGNADTRADGANSVWKRLKADDAVASQGTLAYQRNTVSLKALEVASARREVPHTPSPKVRTSKEILTFAKDHRFVRSTTSMSGGRAWALTQMYDGQDELLISNGPSGKEVSIRPGKPMDVRQDAQMIGLYPGASFVLGRGLSTLRNIKITNAGADAVLEGSAADGTSIKASLDARHGYVAKRIERSQKGKVISRMLLGAPVPSKRGPWIASTATYQALMADGQPMVRDEYKLVNANFTKPNDKLFSFPLQEPLIIIDTRLGKPIVWKKTSYKLMTKEELLKGTREKLADEARMLAQSRNIERSETFKRISLLGLPLLLLGILASLRWVRHRAHAV